MKVRKIKHNHYYYRKDMQGNVIAILDSTGKKVVVYSYDAWGNQSVAILPDCSLEIIELSDLNPFTYRSYYYDRETGLYYLNSRYYDPSVGRFINMDSIDYADPETINGLNLYAYCGNNPISYIDSTGHAWWHWLIAAAVVVALAALTVVSAGSVAAGVAAISAATYGATAVGASAVTTTLAFATVGAGTTLAATAVVATINSIETCSTGGSLSNGVNAFMTEGETAMWSTIGASLVGGLGGYVTYKEQIGNSSQSGFMTKSQRDAQRVAYWKSVGHSDGKATPGMEISHIYGTYGNNRNYFLIQSKPEHIAFHKLYGYKTAGGPFSRINPNYHNWWYIIKSLLGM